MFDGLINNTRQPNCLTLSRSRPVIRKCAGETSRLHEEAPRYSALISTAFAHPTRWSARHPFCQGFSRLSPKNEDRTSNTPEGKEGKTFCVFLHVFLPD